MGGLNDLLLASLRRAGEPMASDDLLDAATALALADGWEPEQVSALNRRSVATRLRNMEAGGKVTQVGVTMDEPSRRTTPVYAPVDGYDVSATAPEPPPPSRTTSPGSTYANLERSQLIALLDVHDALAQCTARFFSDLDAWREKSRARLQAVGLGRDG